jgi:hypothetical protein
VILVTANEKLLAALLFFVGFQGTNVSTTHKCFFLAQKYQIHTNAHKKMQ